MSSGNCDITSCSHSPCLSGGQCTEDVEGWYCECPAQYAGRYCERLHCDNNPCLHGGSCLVTDDGMDFVCLCPFGRHGVDCSEAVQISTPYFAGMKSLNYVCNAMIIENIMMH